MHSRATRFVLLVLLIAASPSIHTQGVQSDQDILMQLERDWDAAFHRGDVATIDRILAQDFVVTYDDGTRGDRATELMLAATFNQPGEMSRLDEFIIREYGETAVVLFTLHLTGTRQGQVVEETLRYTDVFVLQGGRWQCVSSQSTRVRAN